VIPTLAEKEKALVGSGMFEKIDSNKQADTAAKTEDVKKTEVKTATAKTTETKQADTKQADTKTTDAKAATKSTAPAAAKETKTYREYVVKENDTLWKIEARNLGDGNRFNEIAQLNRSINPDNLVVGTKLRLPAK
jgi:nucleoid-associated protein YgaU